VGDYPSADEFAARMSFDLRFQPMPDKKHFLFDLSDEDEAAFDTALEDAFKLARNDTVVRMLEPAQIDRLRVSAANYVLNARRHAALMRLVERRTP
jgi:hypothetical protein